MIKKQHEDFIEIITWWNDSMEINKTEGDLIYCIHDYKPRGDFNIKFYTLVHDLRMSESELLGTFDKNKLQYTRTALSSNNYTHKIISGKEIREDEIKSIVGSYNSFAKFKGLTPINSEMLRELSHSNNLIVTKAYFKNVLAGYYIYYVSNGIARQYMKIPLNIEISNGDNSRLQSFHIYKDLVALKKLKYSKYDWGGLYQEGQDTKKIEGIIRFKSFFGGTGVQIWKNIKILSPAGLKAYEKYFRKRK